MFSTDLLQGRKVVVTGAANGIGRRILEEFLLVSADVVAIDNDDKGLTDLRNEFSNNLLGRLRTHKADLTKVPDIRRAIEAISEGHGIDILVNNVGGSAGTPIKLEEVSESDYNRVLDLNLKSCFFTTQACLKQFRTRGGGSIVNVASISGRFGISTISPQYSAAKGAILALTSNLAAALAPDNIRVNSVAPGYIRSGSRVEKIWRSRDEGPILNSIALRRRGETEEVSDVVLFLASDAARYLTGVTIDVNGGLFYV